MARWGAALAALVAIAVLVVTAGDDDAAVSRALPAAEVVRHCDATSPGRRVVPDEGRDLLAARVTVRAFRANFESARADEVLTVRGAKVLKFPLVFTGRGDLTISVPRGVPLRLDFVHGKRPARSVRFEACPPRGGATGYPGAVLWRGPWPACAPLDVSGAGRVLLALGKRC
jgi:hypothetical protein